MIWMLFETNNKKEMSSADWARFSALGGTSYTLLKDRFLRVLPEQLIEVGTSALPPITNEQNTCKNPEKEPKMGDESRSRSRSRSRSKGGTTTAARKSSSAVNTHRRLNRALDLCGQRKRALQRLQRRSTSQGANAALQQRFESEQAQLQDIEAKVKAHLSKVRNPDQTNFRKSVLHTSGSSICGTRSSSLPHLAP
jgi:hypothetical protein